MQIDFPPDPDFHLAEGHDLELNNFKIQVRHTPGHSPGSVIFYIESTNTAVVGDLIFNKGVGRTDLDGGSFATLKHSIETSILPPAGDHFDPLVMDQQRQWLQKSALTLTSG